MPGGIGKINMPRMRIFDFLHIYVYIKYINK